MGQIMIFDSAQRQRTLAAIANSKGRCQTYLSVRNTWTGREDVFVFCQAQGRWLDQNGKPLPPMWLDTFASMLELETVRNVEPGRIFEIFVEPATYNQPVH